MEDLWNLKYDWVLTGTTWTRIERLDTYWSGVTYVPDNYFKYKKCLSGITYQYVNTLTDIYNKNSMVGKTWCIYDMYNEFDIINNFMVNMDTVDVCSTTNLDLTQRFYKIDNVNLKTNHKILLVNQNDKTQNDLYKVDQRGFLIRSSQLADSGNTFRYKGYVKLGDNKHNQYHLKNSGDYFPTSGTFAEYMLGHTYIIKHFFSYDINAVTPVPKLIFTDYDIARHINPENYSLYTGFILPSTSVVKIKYHDNPVYTITVDGGLFYSDSISINNIFTGLTSLPGGDKENFYIKTGGGFSDGDYLKIELNSTNINLIYNTYTILDPLTIPYIILKDPIPLNILNDFYNSGGTYTVTNLQHSSNLNDTLLESYYSKYFEISGGTELIPKYYKYNHYFDYDGLQFSFDGGLTYTNFTTSNYYIKYKLYEHLNAINSVFDGSYSFPNYPNSSLINFTTGFTVLVTDTQSSEYYDSYPKGTYIKITPTNPSDIYFFRKNTFVNLNGTYKTLIVDYVQNEYFIIETYKSNSGLTINNIDTIYTLTGISDLLYSVYKNDENSWYRVRPDNIRKQICNSYSRIIENDPNITKYVTGLLTQDDKNKFILELYNPENLYNNGGNVTFSYDPNLIYKPIELIEIGIDKHTKIPIPVLTENLQITYDLLTGVTSGSTTGSTSHDSFKFLTKMTNGTFSYSLISSNSTTLTIDWGDGTTLETISFNGVYSGSHVYMADQFLTITFSGDLQFIYYVFAANNVIFKADVSKLKNLITLNLNDNVLPEIDINGLIYLNDLHLKNNNLETSLSVNNVDVLFNILDTNGKINGDIDTSGTGNSAVTNSSLTARNNLISKGWTLAYN